MAQDFYRKAQDYSHLQYYYRVHLTKHVYISIQTHMVTFLRAYVFIHSGYQEVSIIITVLKSAYVYGMF